MLSSPSLLHDGSLHQLGPLPVLLFLLWSLLSRRSLQRGRRRFHRRRGFLHDLQTLPLGRIRRRRRRLYGGSGRPDRGRGPGSRPGCGFLRRQLPALSDGCGGSDGRLHGGRSSHRLLLLHQRKVLVQVGAAARRLEQCIVQSRDRKLETRTPARVFPDCTNKIEQVYLWPEARGGFGFVSGGVRVTAL